MVSHSDTWESLCVSLGCESHLLDDEAWVSQPQAYIVCEQQQVNCRFRLGQCAPSAPEAIHDMQALH